MHGKYNPTCNYARKISQKLYCLSFINYRQSGDRFVVKVKPVQIKGVRMIVEHMIEALPDRKVGIKWRRVLHMLGPAASLTRVVLNVSLS